MNPLESLEAALAPRPHLDPTVGALMLMDLGQKVLNAIAATRVAGHSNLRNTSCYVHSDNPTVNLVTAVLDGRVEDVEAAHARWIAECPPLMQVSIRAVRGS